MTTAADQSVNDRPHDEQAWWIDFFLGVFIAQIAQGEITVRTETFV